MSFPWLLPVAIIWVIWFSSLVPILWFNIVGRMRCNVNSTCQLNVIALLLHWVHWSHHHITCRSTHVLNHHNESQPIDRDGSNRRCSGAFGLTACQATTKSRTVMVTQRCDANGDQHQSNQTACSACCDKKLSSLWVSCPDSLQWMRRVMDVVEMKRGDQTDPLTQLNVWNRAMKHPIFLW